MKLACPVPKILLAVDGSESSNKAAAYVACLAQAFGDKVTKITVLHVLDKTYPKGLWELAPGERDKILKKSHEEENKNASSILNKTEKILLEYDISKGKIEKKIRVGKPWEEIILEGEEGGYSIAVLGKKGRSKIEELVAGSTAKMVVDRAKGLGILLIE